MATTKTVKENILLLGYGGRKNDIGLIQYFDTYDHFCAKYKSTSSMAKAFKILEDMKCTGIHVINLDPDDINSYVDATQLIMQHEFNYIVPVDIYISNTYYDTTTCKNICLLDYIVKTMYGSNDSVLIGTDKHARLYEDIDNYLDEMKTIESLVKEYIGLRNHGENMVFVANNLKDFDYANVVLAGILLNTEVNTYPASDSFGEAIFDIDAVDIGSSSIVYFRGHDDRATTIENLINLNRKVEPKKIITINRIIKYMLHDMDFSEFEGVFFTDHQKLLVKKKLIKYMDYYKGYILIDYDISSVGFYETGPSVGIIVCKIDVWPISCSEKCTLEIQINNA